MKGQKKEILTRLKSRHSSRPDILFVAKHTNGTFASDKPGEILFLIFLRITISMFQTKYLSVSIIKIHIIVFGIFMILFSCSNHENNQIPDKKDDAYKTPTNAIRIEYDGHISIRGTYNDSIKAKWVYDTGCQRAVVDSSFHVESGININNFISSNSFGQGNSCTKTYIIKQGCSLCVDSICYTPEKLRLINLRNTVGEKVADGILPFNFFGKGILEVNYLHEYLLLHHAEYKPDTTWFFIPFTLSEDRILIEALVKIEDGKQISGLFQLDLGSANTFTLNKKANNELNINNSHKDIDTMDLLNAGIGGGSTIGLLKADNCDIGHYTIGDVPISYSTNTKGAFGNSSNYGIIGNGYLERFDIIIDFMNNRLGLRPNKDFGKYFERPNMLGMVLQDRTISEGGFRINGLIRGSKAESSGLKLGDLIVSINQNRVQDKDVSRATTKLIDSLAYNHGVELMISRNDSLYKVFIRGKQSLKDI